MENTLIIWDQKLKIQETLFYWGLSIAKDILYIIIKFVLKHSFS